MGRLIVEQIVTADGYAADAAGGIDFFQSADGLEDDDPGQLEMLAGVDAIVLGRRTYELFRAYWPTAQADHETVAGPIRRIPKHVVSTTLVQAPWGDGRLGVLPDLDDVATLPSGHVTVQYSLR